MLDYASWVQQITYWKIIEIYSEKNPGRQLEQDFVVIFSLTFRKL
ncbi:hypothetical protein [Paenibacillus sp. USDA918EY]|nr:hypothetical protein [Paenibacillus sp. USDA918EY]